MSEVDQTHRDSTQPSYRTHLSDDEPTSLGVVTTVAAVSGRPSVPDWSQGQESTGDELPPLHEAIDPDALNRLCASGNDEVQMSIEFSYCGYDVTVKSSGHITLFEQ